MDVLTRHLFHPLQIFHVALLLVFHPRLRFRSFHSNYSSFSLAASACFAIYGHPQNKQKIFQNFDRETLDKIGDFLQQGNTRSALLLVQLALALGFVCHCFACGFVLVGRLGDQQGLPSWLEYEMKGPFEASDTMQGPAVKSIYIAAYYYTLTTMISVG